MGTPKETDPTLSRAALTPSAEGETKLRLQPTRGAGGPLTFKGDNSMPSNRAAMFPYEVENPIQYSAPAIGSQRLNRNSTCHRLDPMAACQSPPSSPITKALSGRPPVRGL